MAKDPFEYIHIIWDEWVKMYLEGVSVIEIAKQYNKKTTTIYSALRKRLSPMDYYNRKVRNYENMEHGRKAIRAAVIQHVKELRPIREVEEEFGLTRYGVNYYLRRYLTPEQRQVYYKHMRRKQYNTVQKMVPILAEINKCGNIPAAAASLGMKLNSVFVFLKRNNEVVKILTGQDYEALLIQPKLSVHKIASKKYSQ